jgi:hypothetical protein
MRNACVLAAAVTVHLMHPTAISAAETSAEIAKNVKALCTQPAVNGSNWTVNAEGKGQVGGKLLKLPGVSGIIKFSRKEWSGIQGVLDQAADNKDYRACTIKLTPIFVGKAG